MSTSIRPPTGFPSDTVSGDVGMRGASEVSGSDAASSAGVAHTGATAQGAGAASSSSPTQVWLERLDAGEATRAQAVEALVAHALEAHGGARLPAAQRVELEGLLRTALLEDPVLGRLLGGP